MNIGVSSGRGIGGGEGDFDGIGKGDGHGNKGQDSEDWADVEHFVEVSWQDKYCHDEGNNNSPDHPTLYAWLCAICLRGIETVGSMNSLHYVHYSLL